MGLHLEALQEHTIPFTGLKDGQHEFRFELGVPFFEAAGEEEFEGGEVTVTVILEKTPTLLVAHMQAEGPVSVRCDHCNAPMDLLLKGDQRQIFQLHGEPAQDDDELVTLDPKAHSINLTHYLYECLRLALPARHVHSPGQCDPEVDAALGRLASDHEPVPDPRWAALQQLKTKRP
ncbi:MAG: DUF177 domain-containing protein [Flavobacteriales bacterium]|nr:DUF177 domain-containing protein [Flavobacteriales bacterium]